MEAASPRSGCPRMARIPPLACVTINTPRPPLSRFNPALCPSVPLVIHV